MEYSLFKQLLTDSEVAFSNSRYDYKLYALSDEIIIVSFNTNSTEVLDSLSWDNTTTNRKLVYGMYLELLSKNNCKIAA